MKVEELFERTGEAIEAGKGSIPLGPQRRTMEFRAETVDIESRTVEVSFSSETPVERYWGVEVLGHRRSEIDLSRAKAGIPVLDEHRRQIGLATGIRIRDDGKLGATVRFSRGPLGEETMQDVADGIRIFTSVGYKNLLLQELKPRAMDGEVKADPEKGHFVPGFFGPRPAGEERPRRWFRSVRWMPYEISFVSVPADHTVGVGRSEDVAEVRGVEVQWLDGRDAAEGAGEPSAPANERGGEKMGEEKKGTSAETRAEVTAPVDESAVKDSARREERERISGIEDVARQNEDLVGREKMRELVGEAVRAGVDVDKFSTVVLSNLTTAKAAESVARSGAVDENRGPDMTDKDKRQYSIMRALRAWSMGRWEKENSLERELHEECEKAFGAAQRGGFLVPPSKLRERMPNSSDFDLRALRMALGLQTRADLDTTTGTGAVGTFTDGSRFIDLLRNATQVVPMGATVISGLVQNLRLPKLTVGANVHWIGEGVDTTESSMTIGSLLLTPKHISARQDITRQMLQQSTPDADMIVTRDIMLGLGIGVDFAALTSDGAGGDEPIGILNTGGIGDVSHGTDGGAPSYPTMVGLETEVAADNADIGSLGYLTSARGRGKLKVTGRKDSGDTASTGFVWEGNEVNGYRAAVSNNVPDNLTKGSGTDLTAVYFGNWMDLLIGMWGTLEVKPDPFTLGDADSLVIRAFQTVDVGIRHPESFALAQDCDMTV